MSKKGFWCSIDGGPPLLKFMTKLLSVTGGLKYGDCPCLNGLQIHLLR